MFQFNIYRILPKNPSEKNKVNHLLAWCSSSISVGKKQIFGGVFFACLVFELFGVWATVVKYVRL